MCLWVGFGKGGVLCVVIEGGDCVCIGCDVFGVVDVD